MNELVTITIPEWFVWVVAVWIGIEILHIGAVIMIKWLDHSIMREAKKLYMKLGIQKKEKERHPLHSVPDKAPAADYVRPD